jgi:Family of unknown function (DUF6152)
MRRGLATVLLTAVVMLLGRAVTAHHSFAAEYDANKPVTLTGTVTKIEWMNPHVYFYMDVKDQAGTTTNWAIEAGAPNSLYRAGWRKDSVKFGDVVTVHGYLARDGTHLVNMRTATLADGRNLFGGQNDGGPGVQKRPPQ